MDLRQYAGLMYGLYKSPNHYTMSTLSPQVKYLFEVQCTLIEDEFIPMNSDWPKIRCINILKKIKTRWPYTPFIDKKKNKIKENKIMRRHKLKLMQKQQSIQANIMFSIFAQVIFPRFIHNNREIKINFNSIIVIPLLYWERVIL